MDSQLETQLMENCRQKPVKNQDLWMELDALAGEFPLQWEWVKGHAGNEYNEMCDAMTQEAIAEIK